MITDQSRNERIDNIRDLVSKHPDNYVRLLKSKKYKDKYQGYVDWIIAETPLLNDPHYELKTKIYWVLNGIHDFPKCKTCGNNITRNVVSINIGYSGGGKYCCNKCAQLSDEHLMHVKELSQKKYGCDFFIASAAIREKTKSTCIKKYGVENVFQSKEIRDKIEKTNVEKYGVKNVQQNKEIHQRTLNSLYKNNLEKYGVKSALERPDVIDKIISANNTKYGCDYPFQNSDFQKNAEELAWANESMQKRNKTLFEKYGVYNPYQIETYRKSAKITMIRKYFSELANCSVIPNFSIDDYIENDISRRNPNIELSFHCNECGRDFLAIPFEHNYLGSCARCFNCHPKIISGTSQEEKDVYNFVRDCLDQSINIIQNDRTMIINPVTNRFLELDIWIPSMRKALEFQGSYWHSAPDRIKNDEIKSKECNRLGIKLLEIHEADWLFNNLRIKNIIKEFLYEVT